MFLPSKPLKDKSGTVIDFLYNAFVTRNLSVTFRLSYSKIDKKVTFSIEADKMICSKF